MSVKAAILLAEGFEEAEAVIVIDVLRRLDITIETLACQPSRQVNSYHHIVMQADALLSERADTLYDAIILPGGPDGTVNLAANPQVIAMIKQHDQQQKLICPLCSAGARVLAGNQLLKGRRYVCSGDLWQQYDDGVYVDAIIVEDGNLFSGQGLGVAFDFAFAIAKRLTGDTERVDFQARHIYHATAG